MSDSKSPSDNDDRRIEKKLKKKTDSNRRQSKVTLENLKYIIDEDSYYDMIDDIMEDWYVRRT